MELTDKEKLVIAEFIHGYNSRTLIKSEGEDVIELFKSKGVDTSSVELETFSILMLIKKNIDWDTANNIMIDYLNGKLV